MTNLDAQIEQLIKERNEFEAKAITALHENEVLKARNQELRGSLMLSNDRFDALWINTGSFGCKSQLDDNIAMLVKSPEQCLNSIKADAIEFAAGEADKAGYSRGFHYLLSVARKIRGKHEPS